VLPTGCRLSEELGEEEAKRKRWHAENVRRRHNYVPLLFNLVQASDCGLCMWLLLCSPSFPYKADTQELPVEPRALQALAEKEALGPFIEAARTAAKSKRAKQS
jgi:hypothetical protein